MSPLPRPEVWEVHLACECGLKMRMKNEAKEGGTVLNMVAMKGFP